MTKSQAIYGREKHIQLGFPEKIIVQTFTILSLQKNQNMCLFIQIAYTIPKMKEWKRP